MDAQEIKEIIIRELPVILRDDPEVRELVRRLNEGRFADKEFTESRFDRILDELRRDREAEAELWRESVRERAEERRADAAIWAEHIARMDRIWDESAKKSAEHQAEMKRISDESAKRSAEHEEKMKQFAQERDEDRRIDAERRAEQARKHEEHQAEIKRIWDESAKKSAEHQAEMKRISDESAKRSAEHEEKMKQFAQERDEAIRADAENRVEQAQLHAEHVARLERSEQLQHEKWQANQKAMNELLYAIKGLERRHDTSIGALGARWGLYSEQSFRSALKGILEEDFGVEVVNVTDFDHEGEVFGRPDQVELDIIIKNGVLIICELKSSMSKSDMHIFERKARFYEKKHKRTATRLIVISPMVDERANRLAERLGISVYSYPDRIDPATFS